MNSTNITDDRQFVLKINTILDQLGFYTLVLAFSTCTYLVRAEYKTSFSTYLVHVLVSSCTKHVLAQISTCAN